MLYSSPMSCSEDRWLARFDLHDDLLRTGHAELGDLSALSGRRQRIDASFGPQIPISVHRSTEQLAETVIGIFKAELAKLLWHGSQSANSNRKR